MPYVIRKGAGQYLQRRVRTRNPTYHWLGLQGATVWRVRHHAQGVVDRLQMFEGLLGLEVQPVELVVIV